MNECSLNEANEECWLKCSMSWCLLYLDFIYDLLSLSWLMKCLCFLMYEYGSKMKRRNGKFNFGGLNVVLTVDGGMRLYSYIAQNIAWDYLRWRFNVMKLLECWLCLSCASYTYVHEVFSNWHISWFSKKISFLSIVLPGYHT